MEEKCKWCTPTYAQLKSIDTCENCTRILGWVKEALISNFNWFEHDLKQNILTLKKLSEEELNKKYLEIGLDKEKMD